ncbi:hypothetical protein [Domibacillus sp.]|uniref:hypothetical protein n=1 Tax=Domibacillus sp. TaxID=1969783 RepID=UPI002811B0BA|nr:hypothetical protein [Domibacillus sp.]
MTEHTEQTVFTEKEAIEITIACGYDGSEFETARWKKNGSLDPSNGTISSLIRKLKTIFNSVEVTNGRGKKRRYILIGKKAEMTERQFNYDGRPPTEEDKLMEEYIFSRLLNFNSQQFTITKWINSIKMFPVELNMNYLKEALIDELGVLPIAYPVRQIVSDFVYELNIRNKGVLDASLNRLEKKGRIEVVEKYFAKFTVADDPQELNKEAYDDLKESVSKFLEGYNVTYYAFAKAKFSARKNRKMAAIIEEVDKHLIENHLVEYYYKEYEIKVLNKDIKREVEKQKFEAAFITRFIKLTIERQQREDYLNSKYFQKRFYLMNTLILLKALKIDIPWDILQQEKETVMERCIQIDNMLFEEKRSESAF